MNKKRISILLWIALFVFQVSGGSVLAAESERVVVNAPRMSGDIVTVLGTVPAAAAVEGGTVTIQIIRPSGTFGVLSDVFNMVQTEMKADGSFEYIVNMNSGDQGGWYTVYAGAAGCLPSELTLKPDTEEYVQAYYYVSQSGRMHLVEQINLQTTAEGVQEILDGSQMRREMLSIGMLMEEYDALQPSDKKVVAQALDAKTIVDDTELGIVFNDQVLTRILKSYGSEIDEALEALRPYSYITNLPYDRYDEITGTSQKAFFCKTIYEYNKAQWTTIEELKEAFLDAFALLALKEERSYDKIWTVLEENMDRVKLEEADVKDFEEITDAEARQLVLNSMTNRDFLTTAKVREAFREAVEKGIALQEEPEEDPIRRPSGGGGGGGGGGGSTTSVFVPNAVTVPSQTPTASVQFSDLPESHWAYTYIMDLYGKGIVSGNGSSQFEPDSVLTREVFVKMLVVALDVPASGQQAPFADVASDAWYAPYIADAHAFGIVQGVSEELFGVGQPITRQDMAVMIVRAAEKAGITMEAVSESPLFADDAAIADYAKESVYLLKDLGMVNGVDHQHYDPNGNSTKAQAAKIICFLLQMNESN